MHFHSVLLFVKRNTGWSRDMWDETIKEYSLVDPEHNRIDSWQCVNGEGLDREKAECL